MGRKSEARTLFFFVGVNYWYKEREGKADRKKIDGKIIIISEWARLGLGEALRKAGDREKWRKVVARSSLMPQRSFRLGDELS